MNNSNPKIYVASRASIPARAAMWRALRAEGKNIISIWIDEDGPGETASFEELWGRIAHEVASADYLLLYAEKADLPLKGALVEVGMALAAEHPVVLVFPDLDVDPSARGNRPLGSWMAHPLVYCHKSLEHALSFINANFWASL